MRLRLGLGIAVVVALLDQLAKAWVLHLFATQPAPIQVTSFFNLVLAWNHGVSFGMFNNNDALNALIFTGVAAVIVLALLFWLARTRTPLLAVAIGLVIGGAVGNVIDRLWRGAVVDFLDFHLGDWHWFAFNLADAAICVGVGLMVIDSLLGGRETPN